MVGGRPRLKAPFALQHATASAAFAPAPQVCNNYCIQTLFGEGSVIDYINLGTLEWQGRMGMNSVAGCLGVLKCLTVDRSLLSDAKVQRTWLARAQSSLLYILQLWNVEIWSISKYGFPYVGFHGDWIWQANRLGSVRMWRWRIDLWHSKAWWAQDQVSKVFQKPLVHHHTHHYFIYRKREGIKRKKKRKAEDCEKESENLVNEQAQAARWWINHITCLGWESKNKSCKLRWIVWMMRLQGYKGREQQMCI